MSFTDQEAACFLCGSTQDPCDCQKLAQWHEDIQYHGDGLVCEACERYGDPVDAGVPNGHDSRPAARPPR